MKETKKLVVYFSCTGTTKKAAQELAKTINADLFEIKPEIPYTPADLDWNNKKSRSSVEMKNLDSRPAIASKVTNINSYDAVFIGFPIWWDLAPTIINTFIESYDLNNKMIVPFATSGGSGIENSQKNLKKSYPKLKVVSGKLLNGKINNETIKGWFDKIDKES
ncbi:MAG: flavodoxin [Bacteroidales bacterium]|nr:flavodoxin [Bacteroidales bacterium]